LLYQIEACKQEESERSLWVVDAITWLKGLIAAIVSGVSNAVLATVGCNATGSPLNWSQIGTVAGTAAIVGAAFYLKQSPIPDDVTVKTISFEPNKTTVTATTIPQGGNPPEVK
jgi:hypothetical protein